MKLFSFYYYDDQHLLPLLYAHLEHKEVGLNC